MVEYFSTRQVARFEGVKKTIALKWARFNGVQRVDTNYLWSGEDIVRFQIRNKKRGPKKEDE